MVSSTDLCLQRGACEQRGALTLLTSPGQVTNPSSSQQGSTPTPQGTTELHLPLLTSSCSETQEGHWMNIKPGKIQNSGSASGINTEIFLLVILKWCKNYHHQKVSHVLYSQLSHIIEVLWDIFDSYVVIFTLKHKMAHYFFLQFWRKISLDKQNILSEY